MMRSKLVTSLLAGPPGEKAALCSDTETLSRKALLEKMALFASRMQRLGLKKGDRVALYLSKTPTTVALQLACLVNGLVVVPLDIRLPALRIQAQLRQCSPALVAVASEQLEALSAISDLPKFVVDTTPETPKPMPLAVHHSIQENDPAVILMSSGSSGRPKAITLSHGNIFVFVEWAIRFFGLSAYDRFLSIAPLHFDLSLFDVILSQVLGASVYLLREQQTLFPAEILKYLQQEQITAVYAVPTQYQMLTARPGPVLPALRHALFAGEVLPRSLAQLVGRMAPNAMLANLYGPTETNVVSCHRISAADLDEPNGDVPIGRPCDHSAVYICDSAGEPLAPEVEGEICVVGPTVMQGYHAAPEMTERARLPGAADSYRTGDFGWFDTDGVLHFIGRRDQRVKLRGVLVDLGEVEMVASQHPDVSQAVAEVQFPGTFRATIKLHLQIGPDRQLSDPTLVSHMIRRQLPAVAVPSEIETWDFFPTMSNGKLDRQHILASSRKTKETGE